VSALHRQNSHLQPDIRKRIGQRKPPNETFLQFTGTFLLWNIAPYLASPSFVPANLTVAAQANANGVGGRKRKRRRRGVRGRLWLTDEVLDEDLPPLTPELERLLSLVSEAIIKTKAQMEECYDLQ